MINSTFSKFALVALGLGAALSAPATVLYSNLGSPEGYLVGDAHLVGDFSGLNSVLGFQFTATTSGALGRIKIAMNNGFPTDAAQNPFTLRLYADSGSDAYGTLLGTYGGASTGQSVSEPSAPFSVVTASGTPLVSGTKYWLQASATGSLLGWNFAFPIVNSNSALDNGNGQGTQYFQNVMGAFSLETAPVPEPASMLALGVGAAALLRRRRKG